MTSAIDQIPVRLRAIVAGVCLAGSVPPWGWWPLAFVGVLLLDGLLGATSRRQRFTRTWMVCVVWLASAMLWMWDLTPPGYIGACTLYAIYFGVAAMLTPPDPIRRRIVLPGVFMLAEAARWYWPFGGVPLANLALSQVDTPLAQTAKLGGPLLIIVLVFVTGQGLASLLDGHRRAALSAAGVVVLFLIAAAVHPRASVVRTIDAAVVQGGGPTRTRSSTDQQPVVLGRHVEATRYLSTPVDLVLWPENVVNPGHVLSQQQAASTVARVAKDHDATVLAGWFFAVSDTGTVNFQNAIDASGNEIDRYDKVRTVPFGEFVPLRGIVEATGLGDALPSRDVIPGTAEPVLDTPVGPVGVSISWEAFFSRRARDAADSGAQVLTNPTNGSSFWLTQVHTQQVASNQLRAIENDRWLLMAAPTGLSAVIDADGNLLQRSNIGERRLLTSSVEMRTGRTLFTRVGPIPVLLYGIIAVGFSLRSSRVRHEHDPSKAPPAKELPA